MADPKLTTTGGGPSARNCSTAGDSSPPPSYTGKPVCRRRAGQSGAVANHSGNSPRTRCGESFHVPHSRASGGSPSSRRKSFTAGRNTGSMTYFPPAR